MEEGEKSVIVREEEGRGGRGGEGEKEEKTIQNKSILKAHYEKDNSGILSTHAVQFKTNTHTYAVAFIPTPQHHRLHHQHSAVCGMNSTHCLSLGPGFLSFTLDPESLRACSHMELAPLRTRIPTICVCVGGVRLDGGSGGGHPPP